MGLPGWMMSKDGGRSRAVARAAAWNAQIHGAGELPDPGRARGPYRRPTAGDQSRRSASASPLGLPDARADAVAAAPGAAATLARQPAGAGRGLVASADIHHDRAVLLDLAGDGDLGVAGIADGA